MGSKRKRDDDFILTLSDHDDVPVSSEESEEYSNGPSKSTRVTKRKRPEDGVVMKGKKVKKQKTKDRKTTSLAIVDDDEYRSDYAYEGEQDNALDPDFEFELGQNASTGILEDFDGWGQKPDLKRNRGPNGNKKGVDIDDIIARRAAEKAASGTKNVPEVEVEKHLEEGGYEDEDEQESVEHFLKFENDELLAPDTFGAGADSEEEIEDGVDEARDSAPDEDSRSLANEDDDTDSDDHSVASPTAHPDDLASDDSDSDSQTSASDAEESAKRAAFFAPESKSQLSKSESNANASGFTSFSLSRPILRALTTLSFTDPTPIQTRTIPLALAGHDLVGSAVTGSGKTASFLLPILERLLYRPRRIPTTRVSILVPTRELAVQCHAVAVQLAKYTDISFALVVGGFSLREQEITLRKRPDVVIATPGRFIDHMRNSASFTIENVEILVLDEADRMLEDGFADELDEILNTIPKSRQTMLFSATMTDKIDKLVRVGMNRPVRVSVDKKKATVVGLVQEFVRLRPGREDMRLASLVLLCTTVCTERTIVFFRQKKEAHRVRILFGLLGLEAGELHGNMTQEQRIAAVEAFRDGRMTHLLATDLASRGLDIKNVMNVVNYEAPQSHEIYVHRVGRTARAGKEGRACTIAAEPDRKVVKAAVKSARAQGAKIVSRVLEVRDVDAMDAKIQGLEDEVGAVMKEEQEEKQLAQAETQLNRGENMVRHEAEIMSRPKRTWFESEKEKRIAKKAGRAELNGPEPSKKGGKTGKLSGKDKKRLDDRRERLEGKIWRKGKGSEEAAKVDRKERKAHKKGGHEKASGGKKFMSSRGRK